MITAESLTPELLETIVEYALGQYPDPEDRIDWEHLLQRVEQVLDIDLPSNMLDPAIRKIQTAVRRARREL